MNGAGGINLPDFRLYYKAHAPMGTLFLTKEARIYNGAQIGARVYFWAFYLVPLVYISVFAPEPYCLDGCSFVV